MRSKTLGIGVLGIGIGVLLSTAVALAWSPSSALAQLTSCYATADNGTNIYSSADAHAVQQAVDAASDGGVVKVAGTCLGVESRAGTYQSAYISKTLTLTGGYTTTDWTTSNAVANPTIIDAAGGGRVLYATLALTVSDLTLQHGNSSVNDGGGVYAGAVLALSNVQVLSNTGGYRGGGVNALGAVTTVDSRFENNRANYDGGGLYASSTLSLNNTHFLSNTAGTHGAGALALGAVTVVDSHFENNDAGHVGGGLYASSTLSLINTHFLSNIASASGGGGAAAYDTVTAVDSRFENNTAGNVGGGLYANSTLTLTNTHFLSNTADLRGGGVYAVGAATAVDCRFENNTAWNFGGGLHAGSMLNLTNTRFLSNTAAYHGGGVYAAGAMTAVDSRFENNHANFSGGGVATESTLSLTSTHFLSNTAAELGGGVYASDAVTAVDSRFENNKAYSYQGGGLYTGATLSLSNAHFVGNIAGDAGGGVWVNQSSGGASHIVNSLFARNYAGASQGDALYLIDPAYGSGTAEVLYTTIASPTLSSGVAIVAGQGTVTVTDSIIVNHAIAISQTGTSVVSQDYNLFFGNTDDSAGTVSGGTNSVIDDPAFANMTTDDYHLTAASAAIDVGVDVGVTGDFENDLRPSGNGFDLGYDESPFTSTVASCYATPNNGAPTFSSADAHAVQEAVDAASDGGMVKVAGTCVGVESRDGTFQSAYISKTLTIGGGYANGFWATSDANANPTIIDAAGGGRVLYATLALTVSNLTLQQGNISSANGGGVYAGAALALSNVQVLSNTGFYGGGAWAGGAVTAVDSRFENNHSAGSGGGVLANTTLSLRNTHFLSNTAFYSGGGASVWREVTAVDSRFENNSANDHAGGLATWSTLTLSNSQFLDNSAGLSGGGAVVIQYYGFSSHIVNSLFAGNHAAYGGDALRLFDPQIGNGGSAEVIHTTFANPAPSDGAAISAVTNQPIGPGTLMITDCIISNYAVGIEQGGNSVVSQDYNLFYGNSDDSIGTVSGGLHSVIADPAFFAPATGNYRLTAASAAIDLGVDVGVTSDFENHPRPFGNGFDAGYDESPFTSTVASCYATADNGNNNFSSADAHAVQQAVDAASAGGVVQVAGTCVGVESRAGTFQSTYISRTLTLIGGYAYPNWAASDAVANPTIIDAAGGGRVLYATTALTVSNLTLQQGKLSSGNGGGVYAGGALALSNVAVLSNTAGTHGGGVYAAGVVTVANSRFANNTAKSFGGGLRANAPLSLSNTHFLSNTAGNAGGGAYAASAATVVDGRFVDNAAKYTGGGLRANATLSLSNTHFLSNTAGSTGGGAYALGAVAVVNSRFEYDTAGAGGGLWANATLNLSDSHFLSNTAGSSGGGVRAGGAMSAANSRFENNTANDAGGGLYASSTLSLRNSHFQNNRAGNAGGGAWISQQAGGASRIVNSLFARNYAGSGLGDALYLAAPYQEPPGPVGGVAEVLYTTIASPTLASGAAIVAEQGTVTITASIITSHTFGITQSGSSVVSQTNNLFFGNDFDTVGIVGGVVNQGNPAFFSPPTDDYHLNVASAAINLGVNVGVTSDIDGDPRPFGGGYDAGYDESRFAACYATADNGVHFFSSADAHAVQQAVDAANAGGVVQVAGICVGVENRAGTFQSAYISKTLTIVGGYAFPDWTTNDSLAHPTLIDAAGGGRVLFATLALTVSNLTLQHGNSGDNGGGIYAGSTLALSNVQVLSNTVAAHGGGAYAAGAVTAADSRFANNRAGSYGGGLRANSTLNLTNTHFLSNTAGIGGGGAFAAGAVAAVNSRFENNGFENNSANTYGGGLLTFSTLSLTNTHFLSNTATFGGGANTRGAVSAVGSRFENNRAAVRGGGLVTDSPLTLSNTLFLGNIAADNGGGAWVGQLDGGASRIVNSLFARNHAGMGQGDALYLIAPNGIGVAEVLYTTIASPTLASGAAIVAGNGAVTITDSIITSHTIGILQSGSSVVSQNNNLFSGNGANTAGIVSGAGSLVGDPAFLTPATDDYHLTAASAAIDLGVNVGVTRDFDGDPRPFGNGFDAGYDESSFTGTVASCYATAGGSGPVYSSADAHAVQQAVDAAGVGGVVQVAGICVGVENRAGTLQSAYISKTLTIVGGFAFPDWATSDALAHPTLIDAAGGGRVLFATKALTVSNLTLQHGAIDGAGTACPGAGCGGGAYVEGVLALRNVQVLSNTARYSGGGVHAHSAVAAVDSLFENNRADNNHGGGLFTGAPLNLTNTRFLSNTAGNDGGGALARGAVTAVASRFEQNAAHADGGGLLGWSTLSLSNTQFLSNTAASFGGGAYTTGAVTAVASRFENNTANDADGGGLYTGATLHVASTHLLSNTAGASGGGAYAVGAVTAVDSHFENNTAHDFMGGGLYTNATLHLANTRFLTNTAGASGGGALASDAVAAVDSHFENNTANTYGGGLASGSPLSLTNTRFLSNTAGYAGGGAWSKSAVTTIDSRFEQNRANDNGGGLYADFTLSLSNTLFLSNTAGQAGGGAFAVDAVTAVASRIENNRADTYGGGLYAYSTLSMSKMHFLGNMAGEGGGGAWVSQSSGGASYIVNSLFARNLADTGQGDALYLIDPGYGGSAEVLYTTIASPTVASGAALVVGNGTVTIIDTIVTSHTVGIEQTGSSVVNQDYNLFFHNAFDSLGTVSSGVNSLTGDPVFAGPSTDDYHLTATSAAINLGVDMGIYTDFDSTVRPYGGGYDAGYDESPFAGDDASCYATADSGDQVFSSADAHAVQQAVDAASAGGMVKVAGTCAGVESRAGTLQSVYISKTLTLSGGYAFPDWTTSNALANPTIIDAAGGGRVIFATMALTVSDLTLQHGSISSIGGGVYVKGALTLRNVHVLSNTVDSSGGGVYAEGAVTAVDSRFENNTAVSGGGGLVAGSTLSLANTHFLSNTAGYAGGGAIASGAVVAVNSRFENNRAGDSGGGLGAWSALSLTNTHFLSNTSGNQGGGAFAHGVVTAVASHFEHNSADAGGGGLLTYSTLGLNNTHFFSNTAGAQGGGAHAMGAVTAVDSHFESNGASDRGGGLFAESTLSLTSTHLFSNTSGAQGGGAFAQDAVTAAASHFEHNSASASGGGLLTYSTLSLTSTHFLNNTAGSNGGGAASGGAVTAMNSGFEHNRANDLGGGLWSDSALSLNNTHFLSNTAGADGGGAWIWGVVTGVDGRFENNRAGASGGGLYAFTTLSLTNTHFLSNTASFAGGGAWVNQYGNGASRIVNSLFARNRAGDGLGVALYLIAPTNGGSVEVLYTTVASPTLASGAAIVAGNGIVTITDSIITSHTIGIEQTGNSVVSQNNNLFFGNGPNTAGTVSGAGSLVGDPAFVDPATDDYRLTAASAAINLGVDVGVYNDFEGDQRPSGGGFDAGYDESPYPGSAASCYATANDGELVFSSADAHAVQQAVDAASADGVVKMAGICVGVESRAGTLQSAYISKTLTLAGGYANGFWATSDALDHPTIIDAAGGGRVLYATLALTVSDLTLQHGAIAGAGGACPGAGCGGGVYAEGTLVLSNVQVLSHTALYNGGGVYAWGPVTVVDSHFENNRADNNHGGGLWAYVKLSLSNTYFVSNTAPAGGGVFAGDSLAGGELNLSKTHFLSNTASVYGGGAYAYGPVTAVDSSFENNRAVSAGGLAAWSTANMTNTHFLGNTAGYDGGGAYVMQYYSGISRIVNSLFARNHAGNGSDDLYLFHVDYGNSRVAEVLHTTFANPTLSGGAAIVVATNQAIGPGTAMITDCIITNHATGILQYGNSTVSQDYNLFFGNTTNITGAVSGGAHSLVGDPAFFDPMTDNYRLTAASAAINLGVDVGVTTDFESYVRPQGGGFDAGYDETDFTTDVAIAKTVTPAMAAPGGAITFTLAISNTGTGLVSRIVISDSIPTHVAVTGVTSSTVGSGVFITQTSGTPVFAWTVRNLAAGTSGTITLTGVLANDALAGQILTNTATVTALTDSAPANNSASAVFTVTGLDVYPVLPAVATNGSVTIKAKVKPAQAGLVINFAIANGGGTLSAASATMDGSGAATVLYTAPGAAAVAQIDGALASAPGVRDSAVVYIGAGASAGGIETSASGAYTVGNIASGYVRIVKLGDGAPLMGWAEFSGNPCPGGTNGATIVSPFVDAMVEDVAGVDAVVITLRYTDTTNASQHRPNWCNHGTQEPVTATFAVDVVNSTLVFTLTDATSPSLRQLEGTPFVGVGVSAPVTITVGSFTAAALPDRVRLAWQTLRETGLTGFHLYRGAEAAGPGERITADPVPAQGAGGLQGFTYSYDDFTPLPAETPVYYWLEELHTDHAPIRHGPQQVSAAGGLRLLLPLINQGAGVQAEALPAADIVPAEAVAAGALRCFLPMINQGDSAQVEATAPVE